MGMAMTANPPRIGSQRFIRHVRVAAPMGGAHG